jgi:hypothetical protein
VLREFVSERIALEDVEAPFNGDHSLGGSSERSYERGPPLSLGCSGVGLGVVLGRVNWAAVERSKLARRGLVLAWLLLYCVWRTEASTASALCRTELIARLRIPVSPSVADLML